MNLESLERDLEYFNRRTPFRPFFIELASGDRLEIRHPEAISRIVDTFYLRTPNREQRLFEAEAVVQVIAPGPKQ